MNVKASIPVLLAFTFMLLFYSMPSASAEAYNISDTTYNRHFATSGFTTLDACQPYDAKIACNKYDFCVMMVYLNNPACSRGVHVWYSTNGFANDCNAFNFLTCREIGVVPANYNTLVTATNAGYYHLPYDVAYDEDQVVNQTKSFWLFVEDKTYRFNSNLDVDWFGNWFINDAVKTDIVASNNDWIWNPAQYGVGRGAIMAGSCWGVAFNDADPSDVLAYCTMSWASTPTGTATARTSAGFAKINFTTLSLDRDYIAQHKVVSDTGPNCVCTVYGGLGCPTSQHNNWFAGTVEPNGAGDWVWHIERGSVFAQYDYLACHISHTLYNNNTNSITWMSGYSGLHHELAGSFYYMNLSTGMWNAPITGAYTGFGTPVNIYQTDVGGIYEVINSSASDDISVSGKSVDYISYIRSSNSTLDGIYTYRQELIPIQVILENTVSATASLLCYAPYYTDTDTGYDFLQLGSSCLDPQIDLTTTTHVPASFSYNATIDGSCDLFVVKASHLNSPYYYNFTVIDFESGQPIANATVNIIGEGSAVTDSQGKASIEIQPINGPTFSVTHQDTCTDKLEASGTPKTYTLRITASDYQTYEDTSFQPASDPTNPDDGGTYSLTKEGVYIDVSIKSTTGAELSPCNYYMLVNGSEKVFEIRQGLEIYNTNITNFPTSLRLEDDNSTLNVTLSLKKVDGTWDNKTLTVYQNENYEVEFYLPAPNNIPCLDVCDCPTSACAGRYFYELVSCNENCTYNTYDCGNADFCDNRVGCFQADTTMVCDLLWSESDTLLCPNYCLDNYTMILSQCGADEFCKNKTIACTDYCDDEIGACNEMRLCLEPEPATFKVQYSPQIQQITCSLNNIGSKYCLDSVQVPFNGTSPGGSTSWNLPSSFRLTTLPDGWSYTTNTTGAYWEYWAPLVECTSSCEPIITYCRYGCDDDTHKCLGKGSGALEILDSVPSWLSWLFSATFLWSILAIITGAILTFLPSMVSKNAQPTPEVGLATMFVMYIIGLGLGFVDPLIGLLVVIGLGIGLAKMLTNIFG